MDDCQRAPSGRRAVSLLELIVTLAIMGLALSVAGIFARRPTAQQPTNEITTRLAAARSAAVRTATRVTITIERNGRLYTFSAFPDGTVVGDSVSWIDALTGRLQR